MKYTQGNPSSISKSTKFCEHSQISRHEKKTCWKLHPELFPTKWKKDDKGKRIKLRYITQAGTRPPRFVVFGTRLDMLPASYERYLLNSIRSALGFDGVPLRIVLKSPKNPFGKD